MHLPPGFHARPLALGADEATDLDAVLSVISADHESVIGVSEETRESVRYDLLAPDAVAAEHRLITDADGAPVAVLVMERQGSSGNVYFDAYALPELKAQVLPGVIGLALDAAPRIGPGSVRSAGHASDETLMRALDDAGFGLLRRFWRMRIDLDGYPLEAPPAPDGVTKRVATTEDELRLLHSIHTSGFQDHFESSPEAFEQWLALMSGRYDSRADLMWLADCDGRAVAECTGNDSLATQNISYVRTLSVLRGMRGRGIGRWLLESQFAQAAREGRSAVRLGVDSESPTNATALYESVGMQPVQVIDVLARP